MKKQGVKKKEKENKNILYYLIIYFACANP